MKKGILIILFLLVFSIAGCENKYIKDTKEIFTKEEASDILDLFKDKKLNYKICDFIGQYDDTYIINTCMYLENESEQGPSGAYYETIGNFEFCFSYDYELLAIKENNIYTIKEAYDTKILDNYDIENIYNKYTSIPINNYYLIYDSINSSNNDYITLIGEKYDLVLVIDDLPYVFAAKIDGSEIVYVDMNLTNVSLVSVNSKKSKLTNEQLDLLEDYLFS